MARTASPAPEVHRRILETERTEIHTAKPATVESYDAGAGTCSVRIGSRNVLPGGDDDEPDTLEDFPILVDVPVLFPSSGSRYMAWDLSQGDTGHVLIMDTDPGEWRAGDGSPADPGHAARHGLSGAVFVPGLRLTSSPIGDAPASGSGALRMGLDGGTRIEIRSGAVEAGGTDALALAADVKAHLQAIAAALDSVASFAGTTSTYIYATTIVTSPIDTQVLKGS